MTGTRKRTTTGTTVDALQTADIMRGFRPVLDRLPCTLSGKLGAGPFGARRFSERGSPSLPAAAGGNP